MATILKLHLRRVLIRGFRGCPEYKKTVNYWKESLKFAPEKSKGVQLLHDHLGPTEYAKWVDHRTAVLTL